MLGVADVVDSVRGGGGDMGCVAYFLYLLQLYFATFLHEVNTMEFRLIFLFSMSIAVYEKIYPQNSTFISFSLHQV